MTLDLKMHRVLLFVVGAHQVLDRVNAEAMKRQACGIAFLGDFWHSRGSLKVGIRP